MNKIFYTVGVFSIRIIVDFKSYFDFQANVNFLVEINLHVMFQRE